MKTRLIFAFLVVMLLVGTASDPPVDRPERMMGGFHVLAGDFHVHTFPFGWSMLSPSETVSEAARQGLDVVAITPHNQTWQAQLARRLSAGSARDPIVLTGEEITAPTFHLLAIGVTDPIPNTLSLADTIDGIHARDGVAIAAHPYRSYWPAYDAARDARLDGAEVVRPEAQFDAEAAEELRTFFRRAPLTAFGNSDYHGFGQIGFSRTYVFANERSAQGVMDALRSGRTVVYDQDRAYGDASLIELAKEQGGLPQALPQVPAPGAGRMISRYGTMLALVLFVLFNRWKTAAR